MSSGGGGNLKLFRRLLDTERSLNINLVGLISDRECGATEFARKTSIDNWIVKDFEGDRIKNLLPKINFDICFTGIYRVLPKTILDLYGNKLRNIHYSLLPKYKGTIGMKATKMAMINGDSKVGATSHFLSEKVDSGSIINQAFVRTNKLNPSEIENLVFKAGFLLHFNVLEERIPLVKPKIANKITIGTHQINFKKPIKLLDNFTSDDFWDLD